MPKPSIFSKDYDEKMKRRKKIRMILGVVVLLLLLIAIFSSIIGANKKGNSSLNKLKEKVTTFTYGKFFNREESNRKDVNKKINVDEKQESKINSQNKMSTDKSNNVASNIQVNEQSLKLLNGEEIKLQYNIANNERQYTGILPKTINYDISPSKKNIVIVDTTQNMIMIDSNGNIRDITKKQYVSSKGTIFSKDKVLSVNKNYIWCSSAKFLNEDTILYTSQLPWFNLDNVKFLWKYTPSTDKYQHNLSPQGGEVSGNEIKYGAITAEGLEILTDGNKTIVK